MIALCKFAQQGARVQVAEQYPFQLEHAARLSFAHSNKMGDITQAQLFIAHDYHGA